MVTAQCVVNRLRAVALGSIAALVVIALSLLPTSPGYAAPTVNGTLTVSPAVGAPGSIIRLSGKIAPQVMHQVELQRRDGGTFVTLAAKTTDKNGRFTFKTILPDGRSTATYRVLSPKRPEPTSTKKIFVTPIRTAAIVPGTTIRISKSGGNSGPAISADGRYITFGSWTPDPVLGGDNGENDVSLWDRSTGTTTRIVHGHQGSNPSGSGDPEISADGRYIAYWSYASDLVPDDNNNQADVFVWHRPSGTTTRVTDGYNGAGDLSISADGRFIAFTSSLSMVPPISFSPLEVFVWDRSTGISMRVTNGNADSRAPAISADGRFVTYWSRATDLVPGDTNGKGDVFVWDRSTGGTTRITDGTRASYLPAISADGRYIAYDRHRDVFVWDRSTGDTTRIVTGEHSGDPAISGDGRYVTFDSRASDLVPGDRNNSGDVFLWDRSTSTTIRITNGDGDSATAAISATGSRITYWSEASNLVSDDTGEWNDVFLWDRYRSR